MKKGHLKLIFILVLSLIINFAYVDKSYAASASISVKSSTSSVAVGGSFNVTVTVYSGAGLGAWEYSLNFDSSKLTLTSTNAAPHIADYSSGPGKTSASYTYTFRAKAAGTANLSISSPSVVDWNENSLSTTGGSTSVRILTQAEIEASYSKNNYLKSLSVEGATLSPEFNRETLEYSVELEPETKSIKVDAVKEDSTASIEGIGDIAVSEGDNKINVVVTAQNGSTRTYVINAKVKELSPIEVKVGKDKLNVVRQKDALTPPELYTETTVKIGEEEVPAFKNDVTKLTLVALKDSKGKIKFYIYDEKKKTYTPYNQFSSSKVVLYQMPLDKTVKIPDGYKKYSITIDGEEYECYKTAKNSKFALIYGMNVETGKKNWYVYNTTEKTIQLYNDDDREILNEKIDNYYKIILGLGFLSGLLALILLFVCVSKSSGKKKTKKKKYDFDFGEEIKPKTNTEKGKVDIKKKH